MVYLCIDVIYNVFAQFGFYDEGTGIMGDSIDYGKLQSQLHLMLREYVEDNMSSEGNRVGGDIPYPALIIFVGDSICDEARKYIIPEMKRHWPTSFANAGSGRLRVMLVDRAPVSDTAEKCCYHYTLTSPGPLKSLADNMDDCRMINNGIREIYDSVVGSPDAAYMRIIAVTGIEDSDSLITGEILAIARQFGRVILSQTNNPGELFVFLPQRASLQEEGYLQAHEFLLKWKDWSDRKGTFPNIFMRFGTRATPVAGGIPAVGRTMIFDCIDNRGISDTDHWRDRLLVNVLETRRLIEDDLVLVPGTVIDKLNYEYVLLKAMDPANWKMPREKKREIWDTADRLMKDMEDLITGGEKHNVEISISKWLQRACVARLCFNEGIGMSLPVEDIEERFFGTSIRRMFSEFRRDFLSREVPDSLYQQITSLKSEDQIRKTLMFLEEIIENTRKDAPERGDYPNDSRQIPSDGYIWSFKEQNIDPCYTGLAPKCIEALIHKWAQECRNVLADMSVVKQGGVDLIELFSAVYDHEIRLESSRWSDTPYDGPQMKQLGSKEINSYRDTIIRIMQNPSQENYYKLFTIVREQIEDEKYPAATHRVRMICHTTDAFRPEADGGRFTIENGVDKGKTITFTKVPDNDFVQFFKEINEYYQEIDY